jgi:hypothetical protein
LHQQQVPPAWVVGVSFALAAVLVGPRRAWRVTRHVVTVAHEGGHALVGLATGRRLAGIRLHADASGLTVTSGRSKGFGMVATLAAGYLTPSVLGVGAAWLLAGRYTNAVLVLSLLLLAATLLAIRNVFGVLSVVICAAIVFAVAQWASPTGQSVLAWTVAWVLLLGAPRVVWELHRMPRRRRSRTSDADQLAALTHVPRTLWVMAFEVASLGALAVGARWLVLTTR